jgi:uncharacterized membrane protein
LACDSQTDKLIQTILLIVDEKSPRTVQELVAFVQKKGLWSDKEIVATIIKLEAESKIKLKRSYLQISSFTSYIRSSQALWYRATLVISLFTVVFAFMIGEGFYPWNYIRNVLGLIFVLWLPGYTFMKALFPVKSPKTEESTNLSHVDRIALSIIMSMALVALIGLVLNFTPWGIGIITIVVSLLVFSLVFATAALIREFSLIKNTKMKQIL